MKKKIQLICILSILISVTGIYANPVITASLNDELFDVGDIVIAKIEVTGNPGFHGIYFDLVYDDSILVFEGLSDGLMVRRETRDAEFLWAISDSVISGIEGSNIIVIYVWK